MFHSATCFDVGYTVAQLAEALRYDPEGRGVNGIFY